MSMWLTYFYEVMLEDFQTGKDRALAIRAAHYADSKYETSGFIYCCFVDYLEGMRAK